MDARRAFWVLDMRIAALFDAEIYSLASQKQKRKALHALQTFPLLFSLLKFMRRRPLLAECPPLFSS